MYIQSEQVDQSSQKLHATPIGEKLRAYSAMSQVTAADQSYAIDSATTQFNAYKEQGEKTSVDSMLNEAKMTKDQMVVLSHTMSSADYQKMQEEGYHPGTLEGDELVTNLDRIKATLAEAGIVIEGYTDQISEGALKEITGSDARAAELASQLAKADLPVSEYTVGQVKEALEMAASLTELSDTTKAYLVENEIEPTIDGLYKAQHSSSTYASYDRSGYFMEQAKGYIGKKADSLNWNDIRPQVEQVVEHSNLEMCEQTLNEAKWLLDKSIPVTSDNLERYHTLTELILPKEEALVMEDIVNALVNRKNPKDANLVSEENIYHKAVVNKNEILSQIEQVASQRQLEEARLTLTTQVSVACIKQGFHVNTEDIEQTIDTLKAIERNLYQSYLADSGQVTEEEIAQYKETRAVVAQIPFMPLSIVGQIANRVEEVTLSQVYDQGNQAIRNYQKANEKYEQVMTVPTKELGDSIQKAFRNVGAILDDLDLEDNQVNQKAVRILGYNQMAIDKDAVLAVKEADITLQRVIEKITPRVTMELIHKGINPLETNLAQLEQAISKMGPETNEADHYAKYLVQLEQRKAITAEEKEAYIGIYRLMRQVEKSDGAAVGTLVNQGEEVTFKNLLKATRSAKKHGMDVKVDESFGALSESSGDTHSISKQIESYYSKVVSQITDKMVPIQSNDVTSIMNTTLEQFLEQVEGDVPAREVEEEVMKQQREDYKRIAIVKESVFETLLDYNQPIHFDNILAGHTMMTEKGSYLRQLRTYNEKLENQDSSNHKEQLTDAVRDLTENFDDYDSAQKFYEKLTNALEQTVADSVETLDLKSSDARELSFLYKQISLASSLAREEQYQVPVTLEDQVTSMNVRIIHNKNNQPKVAIALSLQDGSEVAAHFTMQGGKVNGYLVASKEEQLGYMKELQAGLEDYLGADGKEVGTITSFISTTLDTQTFFVGKQDSEAVETKELYQVAKQFMKATNKMSVN